MKKAVSIKVSGRVQKVAYRHYARLAAQDYKIAGKIENCPDGSVYIEAQGEENNLQDFIDYCKQGPSWARVDNIEILPIEVREDLTDFN
ncbi:MAG: acylphosphatase [Bacteroidales bacterium]|jgi:acylphosphatase|nr:acylphosphatase [Bacteroidales bacterium]MBQ5538617.1 acylphosphatase [Bacteroidales bacterium]MBR4678693.1 acylphosphatase [Bacteroidales bacterium]MEE3447035.1 acylphosphatase [Bacteroidales bacterium]